MNGLGEKKWFVYLGDHHIGPHSMEEISEKMTQGQISAQNFVWAEGMADWRLMGEVSDFSSLLQIRGPEKITPSPIESGGSSATTHAPNHDLRNDLKSENSSVEEVEKKKNNEFDLLSQTIEAEAVKSSFAKAGVNSTDQKKEEKQKNEAVEPEFNFTAKAPDPVEKVEGNFLKERKQQEEERLELQEEHSKPSLFQRLFKWVKVSFLLIFILSVGLTTAYFQGFLDSVLKDPVVQKEMDAALGNIYPLLQPIADRYPLLNQWISPFPPLDQVNFTEYEELKAAARTRLESKGPQIAMALSQKDLKSPSFYVATNLPDAARFRLFIVGIQDTLVNQLAFQAQTEVIVNQKLGQTPPVKDVGKKLIPAGEYQVYLVPVETQIRPETQSLLASMPEMKLAIPLDLPKETRVIASKKYFLGGKKDAVYYSQLKEYHEKIKTKADNEITEAKEFAVTLENQLSSSLTKFKLLHKGKLNVLQKKSWNSFHSEWDKFQSQLNQIFNRWTPGALQNDYFYSSLFSQIQQAGIAVQKVHSLHFAYFNGTSAKDAKTFDMQLGEALTNAQNGIEALKAKIQQIEKTPLTPNGVPRREVF